MPEKRILIVEDERIVAEDLKRLLMKMGYAVTGIAASGEEAIRSCTNPRLRFSRFDGHPHSRAPRWHRSG